MKQMIEYWPDNDGGLWYYDPVTGKAKTKEEEEDDNKISQGDKSRH